jgi:thiol-disulfide isomerase/thioredoxin
MNHTVTARSIYVAVMALSYVYAAADPSTPAAANRLASARTVKATATFAANGKDGKLIPLFGITITVQRKPAKYRIDAAPLAKQAKDPAFFLFDGQKQYEYNSLSKHYEIANAPKPGERPMSQLYSMAGAGLIITPDAPPRPGITRTAGEETLDGRRMRVTTDMEPPRTAPDGTKHVAGNKTWIDAETGLPVRQAEIFGTPGGDLNTNVQLDFTGWEFDKRVPAKTFAWKVPEGATTEADALLKLGTVSPDFQALAPDGSTVKLSELKGKIVILDFWATWCGPCQKSLPHLQKIFEQVKDKGVAVLAVCVWDKREDYDKWVAAKKDTLTFPTAFDPAGRGEKSIAGSLYKVTGIPTQYLIDKDGKVAAAFSGFEEGSSLLENALRKLHIDVATPVAKP